jgi:hypothetical protein
VFEDGVQEVLHFKGVTARVILGALNNARIPRLTSTLPYDWPIEDTPAGANAHGSPRQHPGLTVLDLG